MQAHVHQPVVVFRTPGLLDKRGFTTFGLNAKPNTNSPIGYFGTGLKYAIAVLVRENIPITIWVGLDRYEFYRKTGEYRGVEVDEIKCRATLWDAKKGAIRKSTYFRLPFTTSLGKNWKLWQAFRELFSNTLDENGSTALYPALPEKGIEGYTEIWVQGAAFEAVYHDRDQIFLPQAVKSRHLVKSAVDQSPDSVRVAGPEDAGLQEPVVDVAFEVYDAPSQFIYYRGVRVLDLNQSNYSADRDKNPIKSRYTYNILRRIELTEDRTIQYPFRVLTMLGEFVAQSDSPELIEAIASVDHEKFWEGKLDFDLYYTTPSQTFMDVMSQRKRSTSLPGAWGFYSRSLPPPETPPTSNMKSKAKLLEAAKFLRDIDPEQLAKIVPSNARVDLDYSWPADEFLDAIIEHAEFNPDDPGLPEDMK